MYTHESRLMTAEYGRTCELARDKDNDRDKETYSYDPSCKHILSVQILDGQIQIS